MPYSLEGVRVLELGQIIAGTYGGQLLSDLGAEVIKVEGPEGDLGRNPSVAPYQGQSGLFLTLNRNKKSVRLNLKTEAGRAVFYDLVRVSDVVVDNFRPGVLERLVIDYPTLSRISPRLIQCSVTGFGATGAYRDYPAFDLIVQAISGHMSITGEPGRPPVREGIPMADLSGGLFACHGISRRLRPRTGQGRRVEISMFDAMLSLPGYIATMWLTNGELPECPGSAHEYMVPWQAFPSDGYVVVATREEGSGGACARRWKSPVWLTPALRHERAARGEQGDLVPYLRASSVAGRWRSGWNGSAPLRYSAAPVNRLDRAFAEPPVEEREMIVEYVHPDVGKSAASREPDKMSGVPGTISTRRRDWEHTETVLTRRWACRPPRSPLYASSAMGNAEGAFA
jgi:crotonobetainyl-CoA:carnitine CoA-transferase CaiB-like acyl-CoA transferase